MVDSIRTVPFDEAGEGCEVAFRNSDLLTLRKKYGTEYLEVVERGLLNYDMEVIELCLQVGGKKGGKPHKIDLDSLNGITVDALAMRLIDAYSLSTNGRTFEEQLKWRVEQMKKAAEGTTSPLLSPGDSSAVSEETPTGQGSETPSSGS